MLHGAFSDTAESTDDIGRSQQIRLLHVRRFVAWNRLADIIKMDGQVFYAVHRIFFAFNTTVFLRDNSIIIFLHSIIGDLTDGWPKQQNRLCVRFNLTVVSLLPRIIATDCCGLRHLLFQQEDIVRSKRWMHRHQTQHGCQALSILAAFFCRRENQRIIINHRYCPSHHLRLLR